MCLLAKKRKGLKSVWPKVGGKNWNYLFYPSAKSRRELKIKTLGVTFRGASAYYVQKSIAPQKQAVCRFSDEKIFWRKFYRKFSPIFFFDVEKWNVGNRLKRVFPKFEAERSHPRGVNGRSKFYKISAEIWCHHPGPRVSKLAKISKHHPAPPKNYDPWTRTPPKNYGTPEELRPPPNK